MSVLLIAEHTNKELKPFTLNAITAASQIDQDLHVLVIGHNSDGAAKAASAVPLVKKVIQIENPIYENYYGTNGYKTLLKGDDGSSFILGSGFTPVAIEEVTQIFEPNDEILIGDRILIVHNDELNELEGIVFDNNGYLKLAEDFFSKIEKKYIKE